MALIKYGQGVASMSGKQGGSVHSRGRTGAVIKNWTKPCNAMTPAQTQRRATFAMQTATWGALTAAQRVAWNGFAQTQTRLNRQGDVYVPTGRQMYIELNANLNLIAQAAITAPPIGAMPPVVPSTLTVTGTVVSSALATLLLAGGATDALTMYYVKAAPGQKTGRQNVNRQMRTIGSFAGAASINIFAAYSAIFGTPMPAAAQIQVQVTIITKATGLSSPELLVLGTMA